MSFFTFITRNLLRRPTRSLLTIIGLAVAVAAVVSLVGVSKSFEQAFVGMYDQRGIDLVVQRGGGGATNLNNALPAELMGKIEEIDGVKQVLGGLVDVMSFPNEGLMAVPINGWPAGSALYDRLTVIEGKELKAGDEKKVMLGRKLAANLDRKVGDKLDIYEEEHEVVAVYESNVMFENGGAVVLLEDLQRVLRRPGEITGFTVQLEKPVDEQKLQSIIKQIESLQPGTPIEAKAPRDFVESIDEIRTARAVAWITSAIALFIGAIGMLNTMVMSVFERTREIGTLRAIGWRKSRIAKMIIGESILLSLGGAVAGTLAGVGLTKFLSTLKNAAGLMTGEVPLVVVAQGCIVAILVGVVGSIYPALWSANLLPTEALRGR